MSLVWSANFCDTPFEVFQLKMLKDNFGYVIASGGKAIAVDVSDASILLDLLEKQKLTLDALLVTHHHLDHISGAKEVKAKTNCQIIGPKHETLDFLDQDVDDEEEYSIGPFSFSAIATPGHCKDHVSYHFMECLLLFCGDCILLSACGRIFDSTAEDFFSSLQKIKVLPPKTLLFSGHDYFERNIAFARSKQPENQDFAAASHVTFRTIEEENKLNPFLMTESVDEFANLREEKNVFDVTWTKE